jgi:hypothetical protein
MEKIYYAEYRIENSGNARAWFQFLDGSRKQADDIIPYLTSLIEIETPDKSRNYDIRDYMDDL